MIDLMMKLLLGGETLFLRCCRGFFIASVLIAMTMLGWIGEDLVTEPFSRAGLSVASSFVALGLILPALVLMRITIAVCRWCHRHFLPDMRPFRGADPELMTSPQRSDFERMGRALDELDVAMGTALAGLSILTVSHHVADPAATVQSVADLVRAIGCIFVLLWLTAGALVLRRAAQGQYGRHLALALLVRRAARLRRLPIPSRLRRRLVVRCYRQLRAA